MVRRSEVGRDVVMTAPVPASRADGASGRSSRRSTTRRSRRSRSSTSGSSTTSASTTSGSPSSSCRRSSPARPSSSSARPSPTPSPSSAARSTSSFTFAVPWTTERLTRRRPGRLRAGPGSPRRPSRRPSAARSATRRGRDGQRLRAGALPLALLLPGLPPAVRGVQADLGVGLLSARDPRARAEQGLMALVPFGEAGVRSGDGGRTARSGRGDGSRSATGDPGPRRCVRGGA